MPEPRLDAWLKAAGWEALLNRKGTTWRKLDAAVQARVTDAKSARALMLEQPSVIKRPVVEWGDGASRWASIRKRGRAVKRVERMSRCSRQAAGRLFGRRDRLSNTLECPP